MQFIFQGGAKRKENQINVRMLISELLIMRLELKVLHVKYTGSK